MLKVLGIQCCQHSDGLCPQKAYNLFGKEVNETIGNCERSPVVGQAHWESRAAAAARSVVSERPSKSSLMLAEGQG